MGTGRILASIGHLITDNAVLAWSPDAELVLNSSLVIRLSPLLNSLEGESLSFDQLLLAWRHLGTWIALSSFRGGLLFLRSEHFLKGVRSHRDVIVRWHVQRLRHFEVASRAIALRLRLRPIVLLLIDDGITGSISYD